MDSSPGREGQFSSREGLMARRARKRAACTRLGERGSELLIWRREDALKGRGTWQRFTARRGLACLEKGGRERRCWLLGMIRIEEKGRGWLKVQAMCSELQRQVMEK